MDRTVTQPHRRNQPGNVDVLPADRVSTSALGEVVSSLVSVTCATERKRVCRENNGSTGRDLPVIGRTVAKHKRVRRKTIGSTGRDLRGKG